MVAFFICWAPFHAQRLLAVYAASTTPGPIVVTLYDALTYVSGVLYYLSTTVNPVLYHIMSNKFREAFRVSSPVVVFFLFVFFHVVLYFVETTGFESRKGKILECGEELAGVAYVAGPLESSE